MDNAGFHESKVRKLIERAQKDAGSIGLASVDVAANRMLAMIHSGSKGKPPNFDQMVSCVGQQFIDGGRIPDGFDGRTLPHYTRYDDGASARGFVRNSFVEGLSPQEFWFHAMGGRIGLIDTAVRTSDTGYTQRKLIKAMEDCKVQYDLSVRNAAGHIIQFKYGDDGMDAARLEYQHIPTTAMDVAGVLEAHMICDAAIELAEHVRPELLDGVPAATLEALMRAHCEALLDDRRFLITKVHHYEKETQIIYPVHVARIVESVASQLARHEDTVPRPRDLDPVTILDTIDRLATELRPCSSSSPSKKEMKTFMPMILRCHLSPKVLLLKHRLLSKQALDEVVQRIRAAFFRAIAHPGDMVGIVAAQSLGEPLTQQTLNTFHTSGSIHKGMQGIPRLRELLSVTKSKTPMMDVYLKPPYNLTLEAASEVASELHTTYFRSLVSSSKIYFDADDSHIAEDKDLLDFYRDFEARTGRPAKEEARRNPWLLRFQFDRMAMLDARVTMLDLEHVLDDFYGDAIGTVFSDDNSQELVCRLRLTHLSQPDEVDVQDMLTELKALEQSLLEKVVVKGVPGIRRTEVEKEGGDMGLVNLVKYDESTDTFGLQDRYRVTTLGAPGTSSARFLEVLGRPEVDSTRTRSNDIREMYEVLGIEAARNALYHALRTVIWTDDPNSVNYRHMALLVDVMTNRGTLQPVNRYGISRGEIGPLAKCSFERTTKMLINAGVFAEVDRINGVSANIMLGQVAPCGTGDCDVIIDEDMIAQYGQDVEVGGPRKSQGEVPEIPEIPGEEEQQPYVPPVADPHVRQREAEDLEFV